MPRYWVCAYRKASFLCLRYCRIIKFDTVVPKAFEIARRNPGSRTGKSVWRAGIFFAVVKHCQIDSAYRGRACCWRNTTAGPPEDAQPVAIPLPVSLGDAGIGVAEMSMLVVVTENVPPRYEAD